MLSYEAFTFMLYMTSRFLTLRVMRAKVTLSNEDQDFVLVCCLGNLEKVNRKGDKGKKISEGILADLAKKGKRL